MELCTQVGACPHAAPCSNPFVQLEPKCSQCFKRPIPVRFLTFLLLQSCPLKTSASMLMLLQKEVSVLVMHMRTLEVPGRTQTPRWWELPPTACKCSLHGVLYRRRDDLCPMSDGHRRRTPSPHLGTPQSALIPSAPRTARAHSCLFRYLTMWMSSAKSFTLEHESHHMQRRVENCMTDTSNAWWRSTTASLRYHLPQNDYRTAWCRFNCFYELITSVMTVI